MLSNSPPSLTSPPWSGRTKRTVALIATGLVFLFALQLLRAWSIVVIAVVFSYLLHPLVTLIEKRLFRFWPYPNLRRAFAVITTFIVVIFLAILVIILIVPPIATQTQELGNNLPGMVDSSEEELEKLLSHPIHIGDRTIILWDEVNELINSEESPVGSIDLPSAIRQAVATLTTPVVSVASIAFSFLFNALFVIVMMFYLMKDGTRFIDKLDTLIPVEYQGDVRRIIYELGRIWNAYLRGQLLLGLSVGVVTGLAATLIGLPQPLVLGLLAGLLEFIPNIGPILSSVPAILFALIAPSTTIPGLDGLLFAIVVAALYTFIQQAESLFLVPRIMGRNLDLHPFVILVAVLSGAAVFGLLGIILAAPTVATLRLFAIYVWAKLLDIDPFADRDRMTIAAAENAPLSPTSAPALRDTFTPQQGEIVTD